jgi:hypothetical protein
LFFGFTRYGSHDVEIATAVSPYASPNSRKNMAFKRDGYMMNVGYEVIVI